VPSDAQFMARALVLAGRARGRTTPNPMVGAVVVAPGGRVVGSGYHHRAGEAHAEVHALREAGADARGATLYCTLEPCCHHGRTPPCVDRLLESGVARVVAATEDPNPRVSGRGFRFLRDRGIVVDVGVGASDAARLNRPFFTAMRAGRPWVIAKIALSADGRVAAAAGARTRLSSAPANRRSQLLRGEVDAIAVGSGTMLADDPLLTCRDVYRTRPLARVVFDRRLRTPASARVFTTLAEGPVVIVTDDAHATARPARVRVIEQTGARVLVLPDASLGRAAAALLAFEIQSVLLEGGPALHRAALAAGIIDAIRVVVTPRMLGETGVPWLSVDDILLSALSGAHVEPCGPDVIIEGDVHWTD
jgi:diaminohydroxyphosphoribosylaminopyrimidine deaminase / 5-amino-6-(5-phosphoribosylamino)uracil reductase